jgi:hypothetical protein
MLQNLGIFNLNYTKGIMYLKLGMFLIFKGAQYWEKHRLKFKISKRKSFEIRRKI